MSVPVPNPIPSPNDPVWSEEIASQPFNLTDITGNVDTFTLSDFDALYNDLGRSLVIFGVNMGMCITIVIVVLILTKREKRRTPIYALNVAGLVLQFLRMLLSAIDYNGANFTLEYQFLGENALIPNSANVPLYLYTFATIPWYIVIISSLILQVRVVFAAEPKAQKYLTWGVAFLGLAAIAFNITGEVEVFKGNVEKAGVSATWYPRIVETAHILYAVTVGVASFVFVAKLMYLIHRRQKMGFKGFGPLQVIVIMGAQCLIVPRTSPSMKFPNVSRIFDLRFLCQH
jgi:pheromone alpha factor receptor